jgi:hypothetical protein
VGNEKQKVFEFVVNDYKSEISKKNDRISEIEKEARQSLENIRKREIKELESGY